MGSLRDTINIAFNLRNFTLIDRFDNLEAIGREHYLTINLTMAVDEGNRTDFAELGRSLLENGVGQITPYGVLFENGLTEQLVYCGNSFPGYIYEDCQLVMDISYRGELETISLPCEELAIDKALHRMGAPSPDVCDCVDLMYGYATREWVREICPDISTENIYELNRLAWVCADFSAGDFDKLVAVCKLTGADDLTKATAIAERIDTYRFTPGVSTPEQLGRRTIENAGQYIDTDQYGAFFDYEAYGQHLISEQIGAFCEGGYIEVEDESQLTPFDMDGNVTMGEM